MTKAVDYNLLSQQLTALIQGVPYEIANLANASALLWHTLPDINWVGFYRMEGGQLVLGPFQGKPACIEIPLGRGVCGTAAQQDQVLFVPDVHAFSGHIACDEASQSELVLPVHKGGKVYGVLDIDSPVKNRFSQADVEGLKKIAVALERSIFTY